MQISWKLGIELLTDSYSELAPRKPESSQSSKERVIVEEETFPKLKRQ